MSKRKHWSTWVILGCGLIMVAVAIQPWLQAVWSDWMQHRQQAIYPVSIDQFLAQIDREPKILGDFTHLDTKAPVIIDEIDYGNLSNWFSSNQVQAAAPTNVSYILDIPKLNIANALVKVGGVNIDHNLVQFNADATIGTYGAPVIFGHSMLRQFYNPKESNRDRYKGIFSTIMTLEIGDAIHIRVGNVIYTYLVTSKKEVPPDDDYILAQNENAKQIKLVTCTPEGTFLRRGVITAELQL
jgi:LPXTG-site transpeptidase (sortase) family protein